MGPLVLLRFVAALGADDRCDVLDEVCLLQLKQGAASSSTRRTSLEVDDLRAKDTIHADGLNEKFRTESSTDTSEQESEVESKSASTPGVVDFESGSLTSGGLTFTKDGALGEQPTTYAATRDSKNSDGGKYLIRTDFSGSAKVRDGPTGSLRSTPFQLGAGDITFDYAGAGGYVALCKGEECKKQHCRRHSTSMTAGRFPAAELALWVGEQVHFELVDESSRGWGHIAVDNLRFPAITAPTPSPTPEPKVQVMELKSRAGTCKGKIGKKGNKWLIEKYATVETCQVACLDEDDCKYAILKKSSNPKKSKCASFKKCKKTRKKDGYTTFKKSKVKASEARSTIWKEDEGEESEEGGESDQGRDVTPAPTPARHAEAVLTRLPPAAEFSYVDTAELKRTSMRPDGRCTAEVGYLHNAMEPFLTADNEPATCEDPAKPCCKFHGKCEARGFPVYPVIGNPPGTGDRIKRCGNGDKNHLKPGESVTITRAAIGEPLQSSALASVITAGGSTSTPWPEFIAHAVGLQYCEAKRVTELNEDFWRWLEGRPDLLLSLAATTYPVQAKVWEHMERLWTEFRAKVDSLPDLGSHIVGFAFMQRKTSVEVGPCAMAGKNAHGDGNPTYGHTGKDWTGATYGTGILPMFKGHENVECKGMPGVPKGCSEGCMTCSGGSGPGGVCNQYCNWYWNRCQSEAASKRQADGRIDDRHLDCTKCTGPPVNADPEVVGIKERDEHPTAIEVIREHIKLHENPSMRWTDPLSYPWALVPYGYYGPIRECEWVRANPSAKCPYTMNLFNWLREKVPYSSNPFCRRDNTWNPISLPRISQDGRVCGGCSYHSFAKHSCFGHVAGRRPEPGHSADFIFTSSGSGKSRTFSVKSPWSVTGGYKMLNGRNVSPLQLIDTLYERDEHQRWADEEGPYQELQAVAKAIGSGKLPRFDAGRLAGMLAEHTYWYVDEATRARALKPLAQRAAKESPSDLALWKLLFKLNSKRRSYAGRSREAKSALYGAIITESSWNPETRVSQYLDRDPLGLSLAYKNCRTDSAAKRLRTKKGDWSSGCFVYGQLWFYPSGSRMSSTTDKAGGAKDQAFGLLGTGSNSSRALLQLQDKDQLSPQEMVEHLLEIEQENTDMSVMPEFAGLMEELVEKLKETGTEAKDLLRTLLESLPVALVDKASPLRLSGGGSLLETCTFRLVAAAIEQNFPEALPDLEATRSSVLENPARDRLKGTDADVEGLLGWIARGKLAEEASAAVPENDDPSEPAFKEWLLMMAAEHICDSRGHSAFSPLEEAESDEADLSGPNEEESLEAGGPAEEPVVQSSGAPMVQSSPEVDACYENWLSSDVAARLKEFLDRELR
jgi:hypothetical protein